MRAPRPEPTILYHLKKYGISRRDAAAHIRKVTSALVDERIVMYERGRVVEAVEPLTVFDHLHKRSPQLRDKVEAQIRAVARFDKKPVSGDSHDMAYMAGLAVVGLSSTRHGRAVRTRPGTTHPPCTDDSRS